MQRSLSVILFSGLLLIGVVTDCSARKEQASKESSPADTLNSGAILYEVPRNNVMRPPVEATDSGAPVNSASGASVPVKGLKVGKQHREGLHANPYVGYGFSNLSKTNFEKIGSKATPKRGRSFQAGIDLCYMFGEHAGIGLGLNAQSFGYHIYAPGLDNDITQSYLTIPVYARFVTSRPSEPGLFTDIGFAYHSLTAVSDVTPSGKKYTSKEGYNSNGLSFQVFAGLSNPVGARVSIDFGLSYQYFFSNSFDEDVILLRGHVASVGGKIGVNVRLTE